MNPIDELIIKIEAYPHKVITKEYVLKHLRALQRNECDHCTRIPVYEMSAIRSGLMSVKDEQMESIVTLSDGKNYKTW